ncbi:hypothetical protein OG407_40915 [Streptomyces sp. NBC_01515]|uniref:hypothetical protein n=1 Tax=Streptomyces sp. NBC_01515 TaxID=2903890 RepID=UPI0038702CA2
MAPTEGAVSVQTPVPQVWRSSGARPWVAVKRAAARVVQYCRLAPPLRMSEPVACA